MIRKANIEDLNRIDEIAVLTILDMKESNIPQWTLEYPRKEHFLKDIEDNCLYVYELDSLIVGAFALKKENDPPYHTISGWLRDNSMVIHRVVVDPNYRNQKVAQSLFYFAYEHCKELQYESIKIDTHQENFKMTAFLLKNQFVKIGYLEVINRMAYEKVL